MGGGGIWRLWGLGKVLEALVSACSWEPIGAPCGAVREEAVGGQMSQRDAVLASVEQFSGPFVKFM